MIFSIVKKIKIHCRVKIYFNMYIPLDGVVVVLIPFLLTFSLYYSNEKYNIVY